MRQELAAAYHESGHAVATVMAFRTAPWLPRSAPRLPVRYVEINDDGCGNCFSSNIYKRSCIEPRYQPLMEAQVVIELAGGTAEMIHRGEAQMALATRRAMDVDLAKAIALLDGDRAKLTGDRAPLSPFIDRTRVLLLEHWRAVDALAQALVEHRRIEGAEVEAIIAKRLPSAYLPEPW
jgi:hypothetical protein